MNIVDPRTTPATTESPIKTDLAHARHFIETLTGSADTQCTWQTFDDSKAKRRHLARRPSGPLSHVVGELERMSEAGAGVFVTVNETDLLGRESHNIVGLRALFVDSDTGPLDRSRLPAEPSLIVNSSRGQHAYWLLVPGQALDKFTEAQEHLAEALDTDPKIHDLPRVMRVPGFLHRKGEPFMVTIAEANPSLYYTIEQVTSALPPRQNKKPAWQPQWPTVPTQGSNNLERCRRYFDAVPGAVEGSGGDHHTYRAACIAVRDFALSDGEALDVLSSWNRTCSPPWETKDIEDKIKHARKHGRGSYGSKLIDLRPRLAAANPPPRKDEAPMQAEETEQRKRPRFMSAAEYMTAWANLPDVVTVPTGINALDGALGGGLPAGQVTQLVGGPGSRKSELVRQIRNNVLTKDHHVLHVDVELTIGLLGARDIAQRADLASAIVRDKKGWNDSQAAEVAGAQASISAIKNLWLLCTPPLPVLDLAAAIQEVMEQIDSDKPKLIILDSLQQLSFGVEAKERRHEVERFVGWAAALAQETGSAVLITSEKKRGDEGDPMHSAAESRSVEYQAAVLLVLEPEGNDADQIAGVARSSWEQRVRLRVVKNREGQKGRLPDVLVFGGPSWTFRVEPATDELKDAVLIALESGPKTATELASALEKRRSAIDSVLSWLVEQKVVEKLRVDGRSHKIMFRLISGVRSSDERSAFFTRPSDRTSPDERD